MQVAIDITMVKAGKLNEIPTLSFSATNVKIIILKDQKAVNII